MPSLSDYKSPGAYVEEISLLPPSVTGVGTSIPAFIGYTQKDPSNPPAPPTTTTTTTTTTTPAPLPIVPVKIFSLKEYEELFGTADAPPEALVTLTDSLDAGGNVLRRDIKAELKAVTSNDLAQHNLYYAIQHYFANGGGACYIVSVDRPSTAGPDAARLIAGVKAVASEDEPTMLVIPEAVHAGSTYHGIYQEALSQAASLKDRVVIMDAQQNATTSSGIGADMTAFRGGISNNLSYGAAYYPYLDTTISYTELTDAKVTIVHKDSLGALRSGTGTYNGLLSAVQTADASLYAQIKAKARRIPVQLPPSAAMAGIYVQVDQARGVWKAPANVGVQAVFGPALKFDNSIQDDMNSPTSGKAVNAIRSFADRGAAVVWGARTMDASSLEFRYISVRRFFNFVEESVKKATYRFVFEPNDANTWVKVRAMIENFLTVQWNAGALMGAKPEHAFFVRVGLNQTMSPVDVLSGYLIIEIGMAVVRPAEFIILRFSHKLPES